MKKILLSVAFFMIIFTKTAFGASQEYDKILDAKIREYGVFDGNGGVVYGSIEHFSEKSDMLFLLYFADNSVFCDIYSDSDGIQHTDTLKFSRDDMKSCKISLAHLGNQSYLVAEKTEKGKKAAEFFTVIDDKFKNVAPVKYDNISDIAAFDEKGANIFDNSRDKLYMFLNSLKSDKINSFRLKNHLDLLSEEERNNIIATLSACADIMTFDNKNYDIDKLMLHLLCTHKNFLSIIGNTYQNAENGSDIGFDDISMVSAEYIDSILQTVFGVTPEHPPVNALIERNFCYSGNLYYYKNIFGSDFNTEIRDLNGVYELGGSVYYVVFSDIYHENGKATPEYSFAVLRKNDTPPYSVIRLGMGESLLTSDEAMLYSPKKTFENSNWVTPTPDYTPSSPFTLPFLLFVIAVSSVIFVIGVIIIVRELTKK